MMTIWLAVAVVGLVLVLVGLRGRMAGTSPACRRCRYSLAGHPADAAVCPECGGDLTRPNAIVHGERRRRTGVWVAGLVAIVAGLAMFAAGAYPGVMAIDWLRYRPVGWLLADIEGPAGVSRDRSAKELLRRMIDRELDDAAMARVIDHTLRVQGDYAKAWDQHWYNLIKTAGMGGRLSERQVRTFLEQGATFTLTAKPRIRRGEQFRLDSAVGFPRIPFTLEGKYEAGPAHAGDVVVSTRLVKHRSDVGFVSTVIAMGSGGGGSLQSPEARALPDGPTTLSATARFAIRLTQPFATAEVMFEKHATLPVDIVPHDVTIDAFEADPALRQAVRDSVKEAVLLTDAPDRLVTEVRINRPPVAMAMEVLVRSDDPGVKPLTVGRLTALAGAVDFWESIDTRLTAPLPAGSYTVVLRPSPVVADLVSTQLATYWGEEIVLANVELGQVDHAREFNMDESLRPAVMRSIGIEPIQYTRLKDRPLGIILQFKNGLPVVINADVYVRAGGVEVKANSVHAAPSEFAGGVLEFGSGSYAALPAVRPRPTTVDVVLKPRPRTGRRAASDGKPWGHEIILKNQVVPPIPADE
jgi:hypothetical protein